MDVENSSDGGSKRVAPTFVTKAELADYLEAQADLIEQMAEAPNSDPELLGEIAARFAEVAREHELSFVAERFDRLLPPGVTGTLGD